MEVFKRLHKVCDPFFEQSTSMLDIAVVAKRRFEQLTALMGAISMDL